jgi:PAS domain S-box-containing protein
MNQSGIDANESVTHRSSGPMRRIHLQHYALAILSVGVALGASLVLEHFHFRVPSALLLLFAVAISSWYGGPGPAALAVLLSVITFYWYFVQPVRTFYIYWSQIPYFIIFTAFAALVSWFGTVRRRVEADLRQSRDLLREQASLLSPALRLALIYAFFGALWILVSDRLSFYLVPDLQLVERLQTYKGWFFIAVTSVLLWLLATRFLSQVRAAEEALHRLNRKLQAISNCNQTLLRATDEQSLLEQICRIVCEEAGYRMAFVAYAEHDEAKSVRPVVWSGAEEGYLATVGFTWADTELGRGPTGTAIRSGKTCCTEDFATDPRVAPWRESALQHGYRSSIALPLKDEHDKAFGSLTIYSAQTNASTPEEVRLLEELAGDLAFGIVTLRSGAARKRAEEALHESETRFRTFVDHAGDALFVYDLEEKTIVDVNRAACESLGYTRQELIGKSPGDFHQESYSTEMQSVAERAAGGEAVFDTHSHRRKDGSTFPVEVHTSLISYGGRRFLLMVARDITERLRAEEALRRSEAYLAEAQRLSKTASWAYNPNTKYIYWSEELFRIFGLDPHEPPLNYEGVAQRMHPDDRQRTLERRQKAMRDGTDYVDDYRTLLPDGTMKYLHVIGHPVLNKAGELVEFVGTTIDVTERKRAEEVRLEERVRERTRIARELHDTLLQSFQGTLLHFQVASSLLPTRTTEAKRMLDSAIDMAAQAITEGRDAIQGLRSPEVEITDLAVAIRTFGESLAAGRGDDGSPVFQVELVGVARELNPTFAGEVYRIATEALRNSFQHAEARHIKVEIHHEEKEFKVLVRDDGKGIDSKSLAAEGRKGHYGLHGMRERAKLVGSEIMIRSEVGAGTEIELRVPAVTAYAACGVILATHSRP